MLICFQGSVLTEPNNKSAAFFGWHVVIVSAVANAISMGLGTLNLGLFIQPMENELNISRTEFGTAGSVRQI